MPKLLVDGYQFAYSWVGSPKLPIILFLHGFLGDRREFDRAISVLSQQFCCLTVDLPGHGETEVIGADECYAMPHTAQGLKPSSVSPGNPKMFLQKPLIPIRD